MLLPDITQYLNVYLPCKLTVHVTNFLMFLKKKKASSPLQLHHGCIYLIKTTVEAVVL